MGGGGREESKIVFGRAHNVRTRQGPKRYEAWPSHLHSSKGRCTLLKFCRERRSTDKQASSRPPVGRTLLTSQGNLGMLTRFATLSGVRRGCRNSAVISVSDCVLLWLEGLGAGADACSRSLSSSSSAQGERKGEGGQSGKPQEKTQVSEGQRLLLYADTRRVKIWARTKCGILHFGFKRTHTGTCFWASPSHLYLFCELRQRSSHAFWLILHSLKGNGVLTLNQKILQLQDYNMEMNVN